MAGGVFIVTPKNVDPAAWQVAHPVLIPVWFIAVLPHELKFDAVWQVSHARVVGTWFVGGGFGMPRSKLSPAAWQVAHPLVIPEWFIVNTR